jgi:hypothetical protein
MRDCVPMEIHQSAELPCRSAQRLRFGNAAATCMSEAEAARCGIVMGRETGRDSQRFDSANQGEP